MPDDNIALVAGSHVGHRRQAPAGHELVRFARQLLAAVTCQAVEDALRGDGEAARFLEEEGPGILAALGLPSDSIDAWQAADPQQIVDQQ